MKNLRKVQFGLLAVLLAVGVVLGMSAFKSSSEKRVVTYFKYVGNSFDESDYRNPANWKHITDLEEPGCIGTEEICILKVDSTDLTTSGSMEQQLVDYFDAEYTGLNELNDFVANPSNIEAQQDTP